MAQDESPFVTRRIRTEISTLVFDAMGRKCGPCEFAFPPSRFRGGSPFWTGVRESLTGLIDSLHGSEVNLRETGCFRTNQC